MKRIFVDPEGALHVVHQMRELAYSQRQQAASFEHHLHYLQTVWRGRAPEQYVEQQFVTLNALRARIARVLELADELERDVHYYLQVDKDL